jgi:hypothetical protein
MIVIKNPEFSEKKKQDILSWMQKCIKEMNSDKDNDFSYTYYLDDRFAIHIVWRDGFTDENSPHNNGWVPCAGIALRDSSYFVDDWTVVPNWEDLSFDKYNEVDMRDVEWLIEQYYSVFRYDFKNNGDLYTLKDEACEDIACPFCEEREELDIDYDNAYVHEAHEIIKFRRGLCKSCDRYFDVGESHITYYKCIGVKEHFTSTTHPYAGEEIK